MDYHELARRLERPRRASQRRFAVLVPAAEEPGGLSLLFEVRSASLHTQPGEVCFPGGAVEDGESPAQAALRETAEELGLTAPLVELGPALDLASHPAGFTAHPFLGRLRPGWREALRPNGAEVERVFTVPLDFFRQTPPERYVCTVKTVPPADFPDARLGFPQGYPWREGKVSVPVWMWQGTPIWGLTARIVLALVKDL